MELLIVMSIIAILLTLLLPSLNKAKENSYRAVCLSNLSQVYKPLVQIAIEDNGLFPYIVAKSYDNLDGNAVRNRRKWTSAYRSFTGTDAWREPVPHEMYCPKTSRPTDGNKVYGISMDLPDSRWDLNRVALHENPNYGDRSFEDFPAATIDYSKYSPSETVFLGCTSFTSSSPKDNWLYSYRAWNGSQQQSIRHLLKGNQIALDGSGTSLTKNQFFNRGVTFTRYVE